MSEHPGYPSIVPVRKEVHKPLWSVMIPTYNCTKYLERTLHSVLDQASRSELMQIEVVDDCSTKNDPEAVVTKLGRGRVSFYRQPQNVGAIRNFNTCIERSVGQIVHILHDDDMVLPGFYDVLQAAFAQEPTIGAAFCRHIYIDEEEHHLFLSALESTTAGVVTNCLERIAVSCMIQTPAIVVRRSVYEALGGFHPELFHAGDWDMWKRIATHYPVWYEPQSLACYREHSSSHTSSLIRSGANIANARKSIEMSQLYLPNTIAGELTSKARDVYALYAFETACRQLAKSDVIAAIAQAREAFKCSPSFKVIRQIIPFLIRAASLGSGRILSKALDLSKNNQ
jgi:glycosyltransferase involved in cell wall biosynthesis